MLERLRRFRALDAATRGLFFRACVALPLISLSLAIRGFAATQATLRKLLPSENPTPDSPRGEKRDDEIWRTTRMLRVAAGFGVGHFTCLEKSLTLWWLLGRQGIASSVRIGTRKHDGQFEAHAWVECRGAVLLEGEPGGAYAVFEGTFPAFPPRVG